MKRWGWATDIHLNFLDGAALGEFLSTLRNADLDGLLVGGDIAESDTLRSALGTLETQFGRPVYFVLGNHDYYFASFAAVRREVAELCAASPALRYLTGGPALPLSERTGVVGHDGWADARSGDYTGSEILFNDYFLIEDLAGLDADERRVKLNELGDEAARALAASLPAALEQFENLVALFHFPPFASACWYRGEVSPDDYLPHLCCTVAGEVLADTMSRYPRRQLTVLCGHTHGGGCVQIAPNLIVKTGAARYGAPALQEVLVV
jgi:3',5'-cyclic-AMP phosphodiesterase